MRGRLLAVLAGVLFAAGVLEACSDESADTPARADANEASTPPTHADANEPEPPYRRERVAAPTVHWLGGSSFELSSKTPDAQIHYTTDGGTPSDASTVYTEPFFAPTNTRLMAIALKEGLLPSFVTDQRITVLLGPEQVATPVFAPDAGSYSGAKDIAIACATPNAVIFYTFDGTTPTVTSTRYTAPIHIETTTTITALAAFPSFVDSAQAKATFIIVDAGP